MTKRSVRVAVSLARVPLGEISNKVRELEALGWREDRRGDPWSASFVKDFPEGEDGRAVEEVRRVMGDYWVDAAETRALLRPHGPADTHHDQAAEDRADVARFNDEAGR